MTRPPATSSSRTSAVDAAARSTPSGGTAATTRAYSRTRPVGNDRNGTTVPSLDVYGGDARPTSGRRWTGDAREQRHDEPNYEQFSDRTVPFAGDYLWVSSSSD